MKLAYHLLNIPFRGSKRYNYCLKLSGTVQLKCMRKELYFIFDMLRIDMLTSHTCRFQLLSKLTNSITFFLTPLPYTFNTNVYEMLGTTYVKKQLRVY